MSEDLEQLRKDAERYRWLRNCAPFGPDVRPVVWMTKSNADGPDAHLTWLDDEELDAAIDAARVELASGSMKALGKQMPDPPSRPITWGEGWY